ncbi:hypothetical protein KA005_65375 [bacterium]|nr:hypothetical protein [bacterium]
MAAKILGTTGKIKFDVTQEHRTGGNGATYVVENYRKAIEHPDFQQAIQMGNAFGYHGHPRRQVLENGKLTYKPVLFPHESEAVATHVCTYAAMEGNFCIHEQAFLDFAPQMNSPYTMWKGKTGGFSSRASTIGGYGGRFYPTKLARMAGFDYVYDRSYRYNGPEGVIASESVKPLELEYLIEDLHIGEKAAHFICNGGVCPDPKDLALEQALFSQVMEHEIALEDAHKIEVDGAFKRGLDENMENERVAFRSQIEEFQETFTENRENELIEAEKIAIECVRRMPRKPHLQEEFFKAIAPALIKNGTEQVAIESLFYELIKPFVGYTPSDFSESKEEYVNVGSQKEPRLVFSNPKDSFFNPNS